MPRPASNNPPADVGSTSTGKRRTRGPNKPKPGAIEVRTEAVMIQAEIIKLLEAHAVAMLGAAGAAGMELQVNGGSGWQSLSVVAPHGIIVRFATVARSGA